MQKEIGRMMEAKGELSELEKALAKSKQDIADLDASKPIGRDLEHMQNAQGAAAATPEAATKAARVQRDWANVEDREECVAAFRELLVDKGVGTTWTWDTTMKQICTDPRYTIES